MSELRSLEEFLVQREHGKDDAFHAFDAFESIVHIYNNAEHFLSNIVMVRLRNDLHLLLQP